MSGQLSRRKFLEASAAGGAVLAGGFFVNPLRAGPSKSPNEKLNIACIGTADRARADIEGVQGENIVALCDVDANFLAVAGTRFPRAKRYADYRKMLSDMERGIDAVVVATPDHIHAPATAMALRMDKHVYCEKPLTHTVREARVVAELARERKLATQMGTQIHASDNYRRVVEIVRSGALGTIGEVYTWCNKDWSGGKFLPWDKPAPANLNWNLWLGPSAERPYSPGIHPANWRRFWLYGSGTFGDMAAHIMDLPFWALELRHPIAAEFEGSPVDPVGTARWVRGQWEFPARGAQPGVKLHWSDGGAHHKLVESMSDQRGKPLSRWLLGTLFVGSQGMLAADYNHYELLPREKFAGFKSPPQSIPASIGHYREWIEACKTGSPTTCNFSYSGALTETILLGVVAYRLGKKLQWDAAKLKATNAPEADQYLVQEHRHGWEV